MTAKKKFKPKRINQRAAQLRKDAERRLRERWEEDHEDEEWEPKKEPIVEPMLRAVEGGIPHVIEALRAHDEDDARGFLDCFDRCSITDRNHLPVEYVAFASGIGSLRLAEIAQTALYLYASMQTKMLISGAMPKVTRSIIKAATDEIPITAWDTLSRRNKVVGHTNGDVKAMEMFGRIAGFVPVPKGNFTAIQNNYGPQEEKDDEDDKTIPAWRSAEERLREVHDLTDPKRLPAPESKPMHLGGHIDRLQEQTVEILRGE